MKYKAQKLKKSVIKNSPELLTEFKVNKYDRSFQIWKREPLSVELRTHHVFMQKLNYIHYNPVKAGLCANPEDYYFSSARFYFDGRDDFNMLTHFSGNWLSAPHGIPDQRPKAKCLNYKTALQSSPLVGDQTGAYSTHHRWLKTGRRASKLWIFFVHFASQLFNLWAQPNGLLTSGPKQGALTTKQTSSPLVGDQTGALTIHHRWLKNGRSAFNSWVFFLYFASRLFNLWVPPHGLLTSGLKQSALTKKQTSNYPRSSETRRGRFQIITVG